jgi:hypothetical protein
MMGGGGGGGSERWGDGGKAVSGWNLLNKKVPRLLASNVESVVL